MPKDRLKNLDVVRLLAAISVVFSHSFLIAEGVEDREPLQWLTGEILGIYGVFVFFVISGYLVTASRLRSSSTLSFIRKRLLRIYPAFIVSVLLSVLLVCPAFTSRAPLEFLTASSTWKAVLKTLLFMNGHVGDSLILDGVNFYANPANPGVAACVNGVFWTLKIELLLYGVVAVLFTLKLLRPWVVGLLAVASTAAFLADFYVGSWWGLTFGAPGFFAGAFLRLLGDALPRSTRLAACLALAVIAAAAFGLVHKLFPLLSAYPILFVATSPPWRLGTWLGTADLSYGVYVWGWPLQQITRALLGPGHAGWTLFALVLPFTLAAAWLSWHYVERRALRWGRSRSAPAEPPAATPSI